MKGLYLLSEGFADANIDVRALSVAIIPAFAILTVCCSIASCNIALVVSVILSNSSMQHMPKSDKTSAPDSNTKSRVSGSRTIEAVRPTADDPFPEVYTPRGESLCTYPKSCDLDVPGSPHKRILISPRLFNFDVPAGSPAAVSPSLPFSSSSSSSESDPSPAFSLRFLSVPFFTLLEFPPNNIHSTPFFTSSNSQIEGASALVNFSYISGDLDNSSSCAILSSLNFPVIACGSSY
mmetsp:Transcript_27946/g.41204  ORF Transcript_27946/g.41204 Transcript_27946/m.41204 type:complete len:236 (-) Transcript_27946:1951-2658(-)